MALVEGEVRNRVEPMELVRSPARHLQPLNSRMGRNLCFHSHAPRRSHLDSASYRTLARILSFCCDVSINPPRERRKDPNPRAPEDKDSIFDNQDANFDLIGTETSAEGHNSGDGGGVEVSKEAGSNDALLDGGMSGNSPPLDEFRDRNGVCGELSKDRVSEEPWLLEATNKELFLGEEEGGEFLDELVIDCLDVIGDQNDLLDVIGDQNDLFCSAEGLQGGQRQVHSGTFRGSELLRDMGSPMLSNFKDQMMDGDKPLDDCGSMPALNVLSVENSKSTGSQEKVHLDRTDGVEGLFEGVSCASAENMFPDKPVRVDALDENCELTRELGEILKNEGNSHSDEVMVGCGSKKWQEDQMNSPLTSDNSVEIEEGEIPDDLCIPGQSLHEDEALMDQTTGEGSMQFDFAKRGDPDNDQTTGEGSMHFDFAKKGDPDDTVVNHCNRNIDHMKPSERKPRENKSVISVHHKEDAVSNLSGDGRYLEPEMYKSYSGATKANAESQTVTLGVLGVPGQNLEDSGSENKGRISIVEAPEGRVKRKRVLTEQRKAKKKKAERKRRAQKEREQGVKRLRLQPIVKPKVVKYCNFYLKGRCQQGDLCRFSHDSTPLTKSQPCRYFACDLCLKGDDCPYDHQLFKYPCHNYVSKGKCSRGDNCKFSHKIEIAEVSAINKLDSQLMSEKLKQHCINNSSSVANGPMTMPSSTLVSTQKCQEASSFKFQKESIRIPKGVRFLSFGKGPSDRTSEHHNNLLLEKHGGVKVSNQRSQEKILMDGHNSSNSAVQKLLKAQCNSNMMGSGAVRYPAISAFASKDISFGSGKAATSCSKSIDCEVSDASKILEEFLFSNGV